MKSHICWVERWQNDLIGTIHFIKNIIYSQKSSSYHLHIFSKYDYLYDCMQQQEYSYQPLWIVLCTLLFLVAIAYIPKEFLLSNKLKSVDLIADIRHVSSTAKVEIATSRPLDTAVIAQLPIEDDSVINPELIPNLNGDSACSMNIFYKSIQDIKHQKKKIRIAYFGDSVIEGDLITENLRRLLQNKYGGRGIGFVPITSAVASFRKTIAHKFDAKWTTFSLLNPKNKASDCGISGYGFFAPIDSAAIDSSKLDYTWAKYWGVKNSVRLHQFETVKMYYAPSIGKPSTAIFYNGKTSTKFLLLGKNMVNEKILSSTTLLNTAQIGVSSPSKQNIFGLSMESDSGIFVDNFSLRGNSGMLLSRLNVEMIRSFNQYLHYDMIVLHYGLNVLSSDLKVFNWYERGMNKVIQNLKIACPNTAILLVGISDKSSKVDGAFVTEPNLKYLLEAQYRIAKKNNIAFFNLYRSMGGENTMVKWVEADTALANKDYTHFNYRGAEKIGHLIYDWMIENLQHYESKYGQN